MKCPRIERLQGSVNGVNRLFKTSASYRSGTIRIFRNGLLQQRTLTDGWQELGNKKVLLHEAPEEGDIIQAYYLPA